jgi:MFS family permease
MIGGITETTPLPMRKINALGLILLTNNASIWMVFAFLPFMVNYYYPDLSKVELGYRAGLLGSAFSFGSLLGNFLWGVLADYYGRRPVLLCGLGGTAISAVIFGFSPNFWVAVFARFLWGFLNGNVGVGKTYMAEILDDSNNAQGMAVFGVIGGLGRIIGPAIGGFLSDPASHYDLFQNTIFESYPFALPSILVVGVCIISLVVAIFELPETLQSAKGGNRSRAPFYMKLDEDDENNGDLENGTGLDISEHVPGAKGEGSMGVEMTGGLAITTEGGSAASGGKSSTARGLFERLSSKTARQGYAHVNTTDLEGDDLTSGLLLETEQDGEEELVLSAGGKQRSKEGNGPTKKKKSISFNSAVQFKIIDTDVIGYKKLKRVSVEDKPVVVDGSGKRTVGSLRDIVDDQDDIETITLMENGVLDDNEVAFISEKEFKEGGVRYSNGSELVGMDDVRNKYSSVWAKVKDLRRNRMVSISTSLYGLMSFMHIIVVEVFPLWLVVPVAHGGFGFNSYAIGLTLTVSGPVALLSQLVLYPYLVKVYGSLKVYKYGVGLYGICCFMMPFTVLIHFGSSRILPTILVAAAYALATATIGWSFVSVFVLINNSCYSHERGTVNGIGQTLASAGRLIGPIAGSSLFAWTETNDLTWPFNYSLVWLLVAAMAAYIYHMSGRLPRKILKKRREPKVPRYAVTMEKI